MYYYILPKWNIDNGKMVVNESMCQVCEQWYIICGCILVLTTQKMTTQVAETCQWLLYHKLAFIHSSAFVGLYKNCIYLINEWNILQDWYLYHLKCYPVICKCSLYNCFYRGRQQLLAKAKTCHTIYKKTMQVWLTASLSLPPIRIPQNYVTHKDMYVMLQLM